MKTSKIGALLVSMLMVFGCTNDLEEIETSESLNPVDLEEIETSESLNPVFAFGDTTNGVIDAEGATIDSSGRLFDAGTDFDFQNATSVLPEISSEQARNGSNSIKFRLVPTTPDWSSSNNLIDRTEYVLAQTGLNTLKYSGFSVYLPSNFPQHNIWTVLHQWWQSSPESPPIALELDDNTNPQEYIIRYRYGTDKNDEVSVKAHTATIPKGQWVDFIFKWKISPSGDSVLQVWVDGTEVVNLSGPSFKLGYTNTSNSIREKFGIYRGNQNHDMIIYMDDIALGDSYNEVDPSQGGSGSISGYKRLQCVGRNNAYLDSDGSNNTDLDAVGGGNDGNDDKYWEFLNVSGSTYRLLNKETGRGYLDGDSSAPFVDWDPIGGGNDDLADKHWEFIDLGGGEYRIRNVDKNQYLQGTSGDDVTLTTSTGNDTKWTVSN